METGILSGTGSRVVIEDTGFGLRAGVVEEGRLVEVRTLDHDEPGVADALFVARVTRVEPRLNAAFLDCGLGAPVFLAAKDARAAARVQQGRPPIRDLVREGQSLIVQGLREAIDDKGPRITTDVRLFGFAVVHRPLGPSAEAVPGRGRRPGDALRERGDRLFPDGRFLLRQHAANIDDAALTAEAQDLAERWRRLEALLQGPVRLGRVPGGESLLARLVRPLLETVPGRIEVGGTVLAGELRRLSERTPTWPPVAIERLPVDQPAFAAAGIEAEFMQALEPQAALPGGGRLCIEPCAALVAIDVDSGGRTPLETDLAAAPEIALQLRLRNLGGTIVVDFVDLPTRQERQRLEDAQRHAFRSDPLPVQVYPMSPLGLVEISRARRGRPLADLLTRPCPFCAGDGRQAGLRLEGERLIGTLRRAASLPRALHAAPDLVRYLEGAAASSWQRVAGEHAPGLRLQPDPTLPGGTFIVS